MDDTHPTPAARPPLPRLVLLPDDAPPGDPTPLLLLLGQIAARLAQEPAKNTEHAEHDRK